MALRLPGKGNFKPSKPVKPGAGGPRRPPVPGTAGAGPSRPAPARPAGAPPKPPAKAPAAASQEKEKTDEEVPAAPAAAAEAPPTVAAPPARRTVPSTITVAPRPTPAAPPAVTAAPPTIVAVPPPAPADPLPPVPVVVPAVDKPPSVAPTPAKEPPAAPVKPAAPAAAATARKPPAPVKRGLNAGPSKPKPKPTLVTAAAAAAKAKSREGSSLPSERSSVPRASLPPAAPPPTTQSTEFEFSQTQRPEPTPTQSTWAPPSVASSSWAPPAVASQDDFLPPTVAPASSPPPSTLDEGPPAVAARAESPLAPASPLPSGPDAASLAAAAVASITEDSRAKRRAARAALEVDDAEGSSAPAKRPRRGAGKAKARKAAAEGNDDDDPEANGRASTAEPRARGGAYASRGRAGTSGDRRLAANRSKPQLSHPELDGVQADDMVGIEVNPTVMTMKDLATTLVSQGRVSARTIKLHEFQRAEEERKRKERVQKAESTWKRRQIVRRKARQIKNARRQLRRADARKRGENPDDVVSDDSVDSDEDYDVEPDRLTPPGSPVAAERVAPLRLEPIEVDEAENGEEGAAPPPAPYDPEDDPEGLGLQQNNKDDDLEELEEMGEVLEDFQLPVDEDDDAPDFSGLAYADTTGGYLDDNGEWVDASMEDYAANIIRRNETNRRNIIEGNGAFGREIEIIDSDTQFVNAATWGKKVSNDRWTVEETELFFSVLRETGENYSLMKAYFPGRTMRQLKNKGLRENRENPTRMNDAIFNRKPIDKEYLTKSSGYNAELPFDREKAFFEEVAEEKERVKALGPPDVVPPEGLDGVLGPEQRPWVAPAEDLEFGSG